MNKRFFTLMAAVMLAGSPFAATEAFAATKNPVAATNSTSLANGLKFVLTDGTKYYRISTIVNVNGTNYAKLEATANGTIAEAAVLEIKSYANKTFQLWTSGMQVWNADNLGTFYAVKSGALYDKADFDNIKALNIGGTDKDLTTNAEEAVFVDVSYNAADLNANLSDNGFKLSFPGLAVAPDANLFGNQLVAISTANITVLNSSFTGVSGLMFALADEAGLKLKNDQTDKKHWEDATFVVLDPNNNFGITGLTDTAGEGFGFTTIKGSKLATNNKKADGNIYYKNAVYTVNEEDQLNAEDELTLAIANANVVIGTNQDHAVTGLKVGAYTLTAGGIKSYITTASAAANVKDLTKASTAGNTYVAAADLLKATEAPAIYNIFFQGDATNAGLATSDYGKYLVDSGTKAPAYVNTDLTEAQWVVTGVGAKGAVTMTNVYDPSNTLSLKLYKTDKAGVYQASGFSGLGTGTDMIKLVPATEDEGSFLKATDSQLNREVGISFSGSDKVTVNYIYPTIDKTNGVVTATSKAAASATWKLVKDTEIEHVVNYIYLKNNVKTAGVSKCKIQTYNLMDSKTGYLLNGDASKVEDPALSSSTHSTYAFKQNATGDYTALNVTTAPTSYSSITGAKPLAINTNLACLINDGSFASQYTTVSVDFAELGESLPAVPRYASFEGIDGGVSMMADADGILTAVVSANPLTFWLDTAESKAETPLFYISKGIAAEEDEEAVETKADEVKQRLFLHTPSDSTRYWDPNKAQYVDISGDYKNVEDNWNAIFRPAALVGVDTLATVKNGKEVLVSKKAKAGVCEAGLDRFQFAITKDADFDAYVITNHRNEYLYNLNGVLGFTDDSNKAMLVTVGEGDPTANEAIAAETGVQVIGGQGVVTVQGAAGKVVTVANILGQTIANQVAASDNVTIAVPAGIVVVAVDGEATKVIVK